MLIVGLILFGLLALGVLVGVILLHVLDDVSRHD